MPFGDSLASALALIDVPLAATVAPALAAAALAYAVLLWVPTRNRVVTAAAAARALNGASCCPNAPAEK